MTMNAKEMRDRLTAAGRYPRLEWSEDGGIFYWSLSYLGAGQFVTWEDVTYSVTYGWEWVQFPNGLSIYCAEVEPV